MECASRCFCSGSFPFWLAASSHGKMGLHKARMGSVLEWKRPTPRHAGLDPRTLRADERVRSKQSLRRRGRVRGFSFRGAFWIPLPGLRTNQGRGFGLHTHAWGHARVRPLPEYMAQHPYIVRFSAAALDTARAPCQNVVGRQVKSRRPGQGMHRTGSWQR